VVPTFREVESLPHLLDKIANIRKQHGLDLDVLIVDDCSNDGSVELVTLRGESWVQIVVRTGERGLSAAVLDGLRRARGDVLVCMDADLSHPPEALPDMLRKLAEGADFVVGSRYIDGGSTSDDWGFLRWLNSRVATMLARPLVNIQDPMAGYFALARATFENGRDFNPIGYKIALELIIKCRCERAVEIPIHFEDRQFGQSKLSFRQQLLYLQHIRRLYIYKFGVWTQLIQFLVVGGMGAVVNLGVLTLLVMADLPVRVSIASAIFVSMCFNFVLNRRFSFSFARRGPWLKQFMRFIGASSAGALLNYVCTLAMLNYVPSLLPQLAAMTGIVAGTGVNFVASRYLVFRAARVRARADTKL
jgi:dolichol-phosphate mannosyltransferase